MLDQLLDQPLHVLWTFVALIPLTRSRSIGAFTLTAFLFCLPREFVDQWTGHMFGWGKVLDIACFTLGGTVAGILYQWRMFKCLSFYPQLKRNGTFEKSKK